jgi:hypothetical protein
LIIGADFRVAFTLNNAAMLVGGDGAAFLVPDGRPVVMKRE